ncbi:unnamed protein product [Microthlaspi erraticum]|uniref:CCHC-type domain-containing protein n=1 Tax=Microthlaspi erraticum TaxID=1685480 RepID=A0A6D2HFQ4_9BRAS|nr:unnamed protein product [Microthlaspi erraticum]
MAAAKKQITVSDDLNYETWAPIAQKRLVENGLWDVVVNGVSPDPTKIPELAATIKAEELAQWRNRVIRDIKALKIMQSSLTDSAFRNTISAASAKELWDLLKKGNEEAKPRSLEKEFENLKMHYGETMESYLKRVNDILHRLYISEIEISDDEIVRKLLTSLSREYDHAIPTLKEFMEMPYMASNDLLTMYERYGDPPETMPHMVKDFSESLKKAIAEEMYCGICEKYNHKEEDCRYNPVKLEKEFEDLRMYDGEPMDFYLGRVVDFLERLEDLGIEKSDDEVIAKLLTSLSWEYDDAIPLLKEFMALPDMTRDDLINLLGGYGDHPDAMPYMMKDSYVSLKKAKSEQLWCGLCEKYNHNTVDCFFNPMAKNSFRGQCHQCGERGHFAKHCSSRRIQQQAQEPVHLMLAVTIGGFTFDEDMWMIYTNASSHMTPYAKLFTTLDRTYRGKVLLAGGRVIVAAGKGDVSIVMDGVKKTIKNVLFVPRINRNVLSVGQITSGGYKVMMDASGCIIKDENGNVFARTGWEERGLALRFQVIKG